MEQSVTVRRSGGFSYVLAEKKAEKDSAHTSRLPNDV